MPCGFNIYLQHRHGTAHFNLAIGNSAGMYMYGVFLTDRKRNFPT